MNAERRPGARRYLAGIAISALLLFLALRQVDIDALIGSAARLGAVPLGVAVAGMAFCFLMGTVRIATAIARVSGTALPAAEVLYRWFPMTLATVLLGHVISLAGDVVRLPHMARRHGLALGTSIGVLAFDRIVGFGGALLLAALSSGFVLWPQLLSQYVMELLLLLALALVATLFVMAIKAARWLVDQPLFRTLVATYFGSLRRVLEQAAIALLACAGIAVAIAAIAAAIGANVPALVALAAAPLVYCGASIPFTFAGWGSREMSMIAALSWSGWTSASEAVVVSLALGVATLIASLPGAGFVWHAVAEARHGGGAGGSA